jgi:hypothetical protein
LQAGAAGKLLEGTRLTIQNKRKWHLVQPIAAASSNQTLSSHRERN